MRASTCPPTSVFLHHLKILLGIYETPKSNAFAVQGFFSLSQDDRQTVLLVLAREYSVDRMRIRELIQQYLGLNLPGGMFHCCILFHCQLPYFV